MLILLRLITEHTDPTSFHYGTCWSFYVSLGNMLIILGFITEYAETLRLVREHIDPSTSHYGTCWSFYVSLGNMLIILGFITEHADTSTSR